MVELDLGEKVSKGGIVLLDETAKENASQLGTVRALGTGKITKDKKTGKETVGSFNVKVDDRVIISKYGGAEVDIDGVKFKLFDEDEVMAVIVG
jgi:chaperonin GroES